MHTPVAPVWLVAVLIAVLAALASSDPAAGAQKPWSARRAAAWYAKQPWLVGFNYVPSTAGNTTEFWQAESFDPVTIDRELYWARSLGFNTCRVFVQYLVWEADPEGLKARFTRFLEMAGRHGITVMPVLFDDCAFGNPPLAEPCLLYTSRCV